MEIIGRVTADAQIKVLADEKKVVVFSIAIDDSYKPKGAKEVRKIVTFIDCTFWQSTNIARYITKGTLVELSGRISARAWIGGDNEPKAGLNLVIDRIKLHGGGKKKDEVIAEPPVESNTTEDDLPF